MMNFRSIHILESAQFDRDGVMEVISTARDLEKHLKGDEQGSLMKGKILATLFFEPSTRTRFSFETAMIRLGGNVISNSDMQHSSSIVKGETLFDTAKIISQFADVIAMRHPRKGAVKEFSLGSSCPVINAGDGAGDHPTQGLLDLYTIFKEKGRIDGLTIGMVGDLKYSRVFHSQARLLSNFKVNLVLVSPKSLSMPEDILGHLKSVGIQYETNESVSDVISRLDVISTNRIQEERFSDKSEFERLRRSFIFDKKLVSGARKDAIIINPLPRVDEINPEIDEDPRCKYFEQVGNGVVVRMALLKLAFFG